MRFIKFPVEVQVRSFKWKDIVDPALIRPSLRELLEAEMDRPGYQAPPTCFARIFHFLVAIPDTPRVVTLAVPMSHFSSSMSTPEGQDLMAYFRARLQFIEVPSGGGNVSLHPVAALETLSYNWFQIFAATGELEFDPNSRGQQGEVQPCLRPYRVHPDCLDLTSIGITYD